jgi:hypothetical protein
MSADRDTLVRLVACVRPLLAEADTIDGELSAMLDGAPADKVRSVVTRAIALRTTRDDLRSLAWSRLEMAEAQWGQRTPPFPPRSVDAAGWIRSIEARIGSHDDIERKAEAARAEAEKQARADQEARARAEVEQAERQRQAEARRERDRLAAKEAEERRIRVTAEINKLAEATRKRISL